MRPVGGASTTTASYVYSLSLRRRTCLVRLAGQQHVADPRGDGRGELDDAHLAQCLTGATQVVVHVEVLVERVLRVDRECEDIAATSGDRDLAFLIGKLRHVEELGNALTPLDLDEQDAVPRRTRDAVRGLRRRWSCRFRPCR